MNLQEIFEQLTAGEFSQLAIGGLERGVIAPSNYKTVMAHINLGLTALYRRFPLKEGHIKLDLQPGLHTYPLKAVFATNNRRSSEPVRYIIDSAVAPFQDDIHKIERVVTMAGYNLGLNDVSDKNSCHTPNMHTLVIPDSVVTQTSQTPEYLKGELLDVYYRANHPILSIPIGYFEPKRVEIELPYSHFEALLYFIASRANNPIGMSDEFHAGNNYAQRYEAACQELERLGMRIDVGQQSHKFEGKGFA
jgi:hypothetical protein